MAATKIANLVKTISGGVVHNLPTDLQKALVEGKALMQWENITPLARNEWICWVEDAKQQATREHRIERTVTDLLGGKRRPCCWPGCSHRNKE
jgi:uncharacterized protein YdeI (YjbR/CyaY-like superfamily)